MSRVLIADDDRVSCKLLGGLLKKWGYEVEVVHDGFAARRELMKPDAAPLAILDWMMPGLDGIEVIKAVRSAAHEAYIYILLLTSRDQKGDLLEGMDAGADDYLKKPFDADELHARVRAGKRIVDLQAALIRAKNELQFAATHDTLTTLWNRGAIIDLLKKELSRRKRTGGELGIVMADIDHFKKINDLYGHLVGDAVIREVTRRLSLGVRPYDAVGRYGGEEFLIVFPACNLSALATSAERLRCSVADEPIETNAGPLPVTLSFGLASAEQIEAASLNPESLLGLADEALYTAKALGRNRVEPAAAMLASAPSGG
ncbi:MAG: diguanylate cyclase [Terriglobales bacterium]|jgi:diguanylate cyclase (GGDEF)-like protein